MSREAQPTFSSRTSGDLIADRRYAYGDAALAEGDLVAARDLFAQTIERVPNWPPAYFALARACQEAGDQAAAIAALRMVLALDPADRLGARVLLARIEGGEAPADAMPDAYVASLFDEYAPRFDTHLVEALAYRAPALLAARLGHDESRAPAVIIDLGCGTGLMARAMAKPGDQWAGVDLSAGMLAAAAHTGLYNRLECGELLDFLKAEPASATDLVLAADVFCYVPDLAPVFAEVHRVLRPGGRFAFSVQTPTTPEEAADGVSIGADSRVHHAPHRVAAWAEAAEFEPVLAEVASTRQDAGQPVPGMLFVLAKG